MPSKDALERDTAHPMPVTKRVWKVEGSLGYTLFYSLFLYQFF